MTERRASVERSKSVESNRKLVFLSGMNSQPGIIRRVEALYTAGFMCKFYSYNTGIYMQNRLSEEIEQYDLGRLRDGCDHRSKLWKILLSTIKIVKKEKRQGTVYYAFGMKQALILSFLNVSYIYEISDILYGYSKFSKVSSLLKLLDKWIIRRSRLTIMTSEGFRRWLGYAENDSKILIQTNRLGLYYAGKRPSAKSDFNTERLVFGFVGAPRSVETLGRFGRIIGTKFPHHKFSIYGESSQIGAFREVLDSYPNVEFMGSFKNPEELSSIYETIDVVVSTYDNSQLNEQILDTNKLYECIFFCRPIVVSKDTYSARQVEKYRCGYSIDSSSDESIERFIKGLTTEGLKNISTMERNLDESISLDNSDELIQRINQVM